MLARSFRLQKKDIDRIYKKGKVLRQDSFLVRILLNPTGHCRFSVVISKKVLPKAHDRNRAKRLVYEFLQKNQNLYQNLHLDIALFPKNFHEENTLLTLNKILSELK